jgi:hypothetical protein
MMPSQNQRVFDGFSSHAGLGVFIAVAGSISVRLTWRSIRRAWEIKTRYLILMGSAQTLFNVAICIAGAAFFASFALTFGAGRNYSRAAAIFYSIGIIARMSPDAWFHFTRGSNWTFGRYPALEWVIPILLLCFGVAAAALLWPSIPQKVAIRLGMILFFVICPTLIFIRALPDFLQFHGYVYFDLTWILYATLWFRVRDRYAGIEEDMPGVPPLLS